MAIFEAGKYQVHGNHYQNMAIDPNYFGMANCWDTDAFQILKYLSRHTKKDGKKDLEKAKSYIDIRLQHSLFIHTPFPQIVTMEIYCAKNEFDGGTDYALRCLDEWVNTGKPSLDKAEKLRSAIYVLIDRYS